MKYKDILPDKILNKFGKHKEKIGNLELKEGEYKIDVFKIAEICDIDVKEFEKYLLINEGKMRFKAAKKIAYKLREPAYNKLLGYNKHEQI